MNKKKTIEINNFFFQDVDTVDELDSKFYFAATKFYPKFV